MLSICSDLDETPDGDAYLAYARYLNSHEMTRAGRGVDLEIGNTIFFDMNPDAFSYWNASAGERDQIRTLIRSGHIDCFHSFGDTARGRGDARRNLDELEKHDCRLTVWVDHAIAPSNLGRDIMLGHGDIPGDPAYHADYTLAHGVKYVWIGRVTACMGQGVPYSPWSSLIGRLDGRALVNTVRDVTKLARGHLGDNKYALHAGNRLTRPYTLRDGREVIEFMRCNPNPHGVSVGDNSPGIPAALNPQLLDHLVSRGGFAILYTHLGKGLDPRTLVPPATQEAFERLADRFRRGEILVTTTRRLLDFHTMTQRIDVRLQGTTLTIASRGECLDGLTIEGLPEHVVCLVDGRETPLERLGATQRDGFTWGFPWRRLSWPL